MRSGSAEGIRRLRKINVDLLVRPVILREMNSIAQLENEIRYEKRPGIHTYHACACGLPARGDRCWQCISLEIECKRKVTGKAVIKKRN